MNLVDKISEIEKEETNQNNELYVNNLEGKRIAKYMMDDYAHWKGQLYQTSQKPKSYL